MKLILWVCPTCEIPRDLSWPRCKHCHTTLVLREFKDFEEEEREEDGTAGAQAPREQGCPTGVVR